MKRINTLVIGAGQAGLSISYYLTRAGREHLILERERIAKSWRDERWDSFTLVTPNRYLRLPGMEYHGDDPDGYLALPEVVAYLQAFAASIDPPVIEGVEATAVEALPGSRELIVRSSAGDFQATNVVVAVGTHQRPRLPAFSSRLNGDVLQVHSTRYRNPDGLPPGAVLVVGSSQSGCQIAEELFESGRQVYLSTGRARRMPRRYRGQDMFKWLVDTKFMDRTVDMLESPAERFAPNPHATGKNGGHTINLHRFSQDGIHLLGRLQDGDGAHLHIAADLRDNLEVGDKFARAVKTGIDAYIQEHGLQAPEDDEPELTAGYKATQLTELDLGSSGIRSIVWATGYRYDFSWISFPIFDEYGYPVQQRGVTSVPGLYFVGLHWLHTTKSGLLMGVGEDAAHVVEHMLAEPVAVNI